MTFEQTLALLLITFIVIVVGGILDNNKPRY